MEEVPPTNLKSYSVEQLDKKEKDKPHSHKALFIILGLLFLVFIMIAGIVGYYLGSMNNSVSEAIINDIDQEEKGEYVTVESSPTPTKKSNIPSDWTMNDSKLCNVKVPLPPNKEPYIIPEGTDDNQMDDGGKWVFKDLPSSNPNSIFKNQTIAHFTNELGAGYIAGGVFIKCNKNDNELTTKEFVDNYVGEYISYPISVVKSENVTLWGQDVVALYIDGGAHDSDRPNYFFANENGQYEVVMYSMSENMNIKDATTKIFDNLEFE